MQLLFRVFRLATNSLTGNWKPGGSILHPHQLLLRKAIKHYRVILNIDSTSTVIDHPCLHHHHPLHNKELYQNLTISHIHNLPLQ